MIVISIKQIAILDGIFFSKFYEKLIMNLESDCKREFDSLGVTRNQVLTEWIIEAKKYFLADEVSVYRYVCLHLRNVDFRKKRPEWIENILTDNRSTSSDKLTMIEYQIINREFE